MTPVLVTKAHAYGNDFLLVPKVDASGDPGYLARRLCDRHRGIGADGLILCELRPGMSTMELYNADGSPSELSGNGLRCLAALMAKLLNLQAGGKVVIETGAGLKTLDLLERNGSRYSFRAAMGVPTDLREVEIPLDDERIRAVVLGMGNPQCIVLGPLPDDARFRRIGQALATHAMFPAGTNVEFAEVEASGRVRILIWERGVGPTSSSGTGTCASAVAAAQFGGAARTVEVAAPGGTQLVEWLDDGVYLTGWADVVMEGQWIADPA
ncbi:MAG: diaminopimelate epimerase [Vicinamibacterales bacterium]